MMNRNDPIEHSQNASGGVSVDDAQTLATERVRESISALFDGEADELALRRLLSNEAPELVRNAWRDYQLQRDALQGLDVRFAAFDISARVQAAIADDAVPTVALGDKRWWRPFASVAVAASVATVVVIGARSFNPVFNSFDNSRDSSAVAQTQAPAAANLGRVYPTSINPNIGNVAVSAQTFGSLTPSNGSGNLLSENGPSNPSQGVIFSQNGMAGAGLLGAQTAGFNADQLAEQRLQQYLLRHTERASLNNGQGVISFSKVSQLNAE